MATYVLPLETSANEKWVVKKSFETPGAHYYWSGCAVARWQGFYGPEDPKFAEREIDRFIEDSFKHGDRYGIGAGIAKQGERSYYPNGANPGGLTVPPFVFFATKEAYQDAFNTPVRNRIDTGKKITAYIRAHKLGKVVRTPEMFNTYHGPSVMACFVWMPDWVALKERGLAKGLIKEQASEDTSGLSGLKS